jgi:hypothetical protein
MKHGLNPSLKLLLEQLAVGKPFAANRALYRAIDPMACELRDVPPMLLVHVVRGSS